MDPQKSRPVTVTLVRSQNNATALIPGTHQLKKDSSPHIIQRQVAHLIDDQHLGRQVNPHPGPVGLRARPGRDPADGTNLDPCRFSSSISCTSLPRNSSPHLLRSRVDAGLNLNYAWPPFQPVLWEFLHRRRHFGVFEKLIRMCLYQLPAG